MTDQTYTDLKGARPSKIETDAAEISYKLLTAIFLNPSVFKDNDSLTRALRSQGAFAALELSFDYESSKHQKAKVSLNHLKKQCDSCFDRGFRELDQLRSRALERIIESEKKESRPRKRTKSGLGALVKELEILLHIQRKTNHVLLAGLNEAIRELGVVSRETNPEPRIRLADAAIEGLREIVNLSSFRGAPVVIKSNITEIKERTQS